jgi:AcrR family transcriptional regulator
LRTAAIELYLEFGYENVTVAQIAEHAGLTRRTFSRYFADKRDVLFAGSDQLPGLLADALRRVDPGLAPLEAVLYALTAIAPALGDRVAPHAAQRREVVARSPELQERGRTKFAAVADALAGVLRERGANASDSRLFADVGVAIFRTGFDRWVDALDSVDLASCLREVGAQLTRPVVEPSPTCGNPANTAERENDHVVQPRGRRRD